MLHVQLYQLAVNIAVKNNTNHIDTILFSFCHNFSPSFGTSTPIGQMCSNLYSVRDNIHGQREKYTRWIWNHYNLSALFL